MRIVDALGRATRFTLNIESTEAPAAMLFQPNIPEGIDYFDERTQRSTVIEVSVE